MLWVWTEAFVTQIFVSERGKEEAFCHNLLISFFFTHAKWNIPFTISPHTEMSFICKMEPFH